MPLTKVETHNIDNYAVTTEKLSNTAVAAFAQTLTPKISTIIETDATYTALDDTAMNTSGGFIVITGADFQSGATVIVDTVTANSTTFVNSTTLQAQLPARSAGTYSLYVVNPDGGTAIRVNGITYSAFPAFSTGATLSNQNANAAFGVAISASSDSNISYSNTSALPAGTQLLSNGWFYGTVTIGAETTYSFTVKATDVELQDTSRTFSLTVTVTPPPGLWAWGNNTQGQLGQNNVVGKSSPVQVGTQSTWGYVVGGGGGLSTLATKTDGTLWAWGWEVYGQLGLNSVGINRSSPVQVGSLTSWNTFGISVGSSFMMANRSGSLFLWGTNAYGELGQNDRGPLNGTTQRSSPTQVGSATNWNQVSAGRNFVMATKTDGTLWTWGNNGFGQLGHNTVYVYRSSPTQVGTGTNWSVVSAGYGIMAATKSDGTLWVWGSGILGGLGLNSIVNRSSPTQLGVATNWTMVRAAQYAMIATKTDGTLWAWGFNGSGQLGLNDTIRRSSPVQVGSGTNWAQAPFALSIGFGATISTMALKTDGTLWAWGNNNSGQLGQGDSVNRSSPTQVGTHTNWSKAFAGGTESFAIRT